MNAPAAGAAPASARRRRSAAGLERRLRPTERAWGLLLAGALLFAAAYIFGRPEFLALGVFVAVLPIGTYALRCCWKPRIEVSRQLHPGVLSAGERLRVMVELRNSSLLPLEPATYFDLVPMGGGRHGSVGGVLPQIASRLHPREQRRRRRVAYTLDALPRGVHEIGPLYLENADGLGLTRRVFRAGGAERVEVWPRLRHLELLEVHALRAEGAGEAGISRAGDSDDVLIREYRRGDALRRVHWRATARSGELRVRQEEQHAESQTLVVLDTTPAARRQTGTQTTIFELIDQAQAGRPEPDDAAFELAVSLAASIIAQLHAAGGEIRLLQTAPENAGDDGGRGETHGEAESPEAERVRAGASLDAVMRRLMLVQPASSAPEAIDRIEQAVARLGRGPLVYVHRGLAGAPFERLAAAGTGAAPAIAVLVTNGLLPPQAARLAQAGWHVYTMNAFAAAPWSTLRAAVPA